MADKPSAKQILVINGPNLNLLGTREPETYGHETLEDIQKACSDKATEHNASCAFFQSNHEGEIVDKIQSSKGKVDAIIINPGALTHTSVAIRDAFLATDIPFYEVHLSNVYARESFRHTSYLSDIAKGVLVGLGSKGYLLALDAYLN